MIKAIDQHCWLNIIEAFDEVRGPNGEPSIADCKAIDLDLIIKDWQDWDVLENFYGHPNYKVLYTAGRLAYMYHSIGEKVTANRILVVELDIDMERPAD